MSRMSPVISGGLIILIFILMGIVGVYGYDTYLRPGVAFARSAQMMNDFRSANFRIEQSSELEVQFLGEVEGLIPDQVIHSELNGSGSIDLPSQRLHMKIDSSLNNESPTHIEYYIVENDFYLIDKSDSLKSPLEDAVSEYGDAIIDIPQFQTNQVWITLNPQAQFQLVGERIFDGQTVYEYKILLTQDDIKQLTLSIIEGIEASIGNDQLQFSTSIGEITYNIYVSEDDQIPIKEILNISNFEVEFTDLARMSIHNYMVSIIYSDVNKPIMISPPNPR